MAASATPTPWNRHPTSIGDFRWWDEIFLKPSSPIASGDATTVHGTMSLYELPHDLLVSALDGLVSSLDEPCLKTSPGSETLKTSIVSGPQTTHFHRNSCSRRHRPKTSQIKPIPPPDGDSRLPKRRDCDLHGRVRRRHHRRSRGGFSPNHSSHSHRVCNRPRNDNSTKSLPPSDGDYRLLNRGEQEPGKSDPRDIYGCYSAIFCSSTMTGDDEDTNKAETTLTRSRSRSRSASRSRPQPGPSILEVLTSTKTIDGGKLGVKGIETFASIASRPPSPNSMRHTDMEAALSAAKEELAAAITKHSADFMLKFL